MKSIVQNFVITGCAVLTAAAQIDLCGGKAQVGNLYNHGCLGSPVALGTLQAGAVTNHSGLFDPIADGDGTSNCIEYIAGTLPTIRQLYLSRNFPSLAITSSDYENRSLSFDRSPLQPPCAVLQFSHYWVCNSRRLPAVFGEAVH